MSVSKFGLRYERLLFFAAPLTVACLLVLFVAVGFDQQAERRSAKCLRAAVVAIKGNSYHLNEAFLGRTVIIRGSSAGSYLLALRFVLIPAEIENRCDSYFSIGKDDSKEWKIKPGDLVNSLELKIGNLEKKPLLFFGIEVPDRATISVFGTPIKLELGTLVRLLQLALLPLLLLWLGSLYNTRHRETLFNSRLSEVGGLYPHIVNVYPVLVGDKTVGFGTLRRKNWADYFLDKYVVPTLFAIIRVALLLVFLAPPVVSYIASLFYIDSGGFVSINVASGFLVFIFAMFNIIIEFNSWHFNRRFNVWI